MSLEKPYIHEIVVVEGLHDKQAVDDAVTADVWVIGGDRIAHTFIRELERAARTRGVIVLTDPDGPGERIRRRIANAIPAARHAFVPKHCAVAPSGIGVEHTAPSVISAALFAARQSVDEKARKEFVQADLTEHGLLGGRHASVLRQRVGEALGIGYANGKSFLYKLNALCVTREEWNQAIADALGKEPDCL